MSTPVRNIAIIGATGNLGSHAVKHILSSGTQNVTVFTRHDSNSTPPSGVTVSKVDYNSEDSLVAALRGQQFLLISLSSSTPSDVHPRIVAAAAKAGVPYVMPNYFAYGLGERAGTLSSDEIHGRFMDPVEDVKKTEGVSFIAMVCGFWYEFSLGMGQEWFGFDIPNRAVTFYDDGMKRINTSTWEQCGRAVAELLQLSEEKLSDWKDKGLYFSSFLVSQRDMLDSLHRVLGTTDVDWTITYHDSKERWQEGMSEMQVGNRKGYAKAMYARIFFPEADSGGNYETGYQLDNEVLGLPKEDLDKATMKAVAISQSGMKYL